MSEQKWLPIETVPKDGTEVLLHIPPRHVCAGCWAFPSWNFGIEPADADYPWLIFDISTGGMNAYMEDKPTHWMPLPQPPKEQ